MRLLPYAVLILYYSVVICGYLVLRFVHTRMMLALDAVDAMPARQRASL